MKYFPIGHGNNEDHGLGSGYGFGKGFAGGIGFGQGKGTFGAGKGHEFSYDSGLYPYALIQYWK